MSDNEFKEGRSKTTKDLSNLASRARNKTIMLSPEITGEMRGKFAKGKKFQEEPKGIENVNEGATEEFVPGEEFNEMVEEQKKENLSISALAEQNKQEEQEEEVKKESKEKADLASISLDTEPAKKEEPKEAQEETPLGLDVSFEKKEATQVPNQTAQPPRPNQSSPMETYPSPGNQKPTSTNINNQSTVQSAPATNASGSQVTWAKESEIRGFLVSYDFDPNGEFYVLRKGRLVVTSEPVMGSHFLIADETVSPMHAILKINDSDEIQILDQLSEYGTKIEQQTGEIIELAGDKAKMKSGDTVVFGERKFIVCMVNGGNG